MKYNMKKYFFILCFQFLITLIYQSNVSAQSKGITIKDSKVLVYEPTQILNQMKGRKIRTILLPEINEAFDKEADNEKNATYICEVNGWKRKDGYKIDVLRVLNIEGGIIYFYSVITPKKQYKICYGVRLVKGTAGNEKNYEYNVNEFYPDLYTRSLEEAYKAESVAIVVKSAEKKPVFEVNITNKVTSTRSTYTLNPAESDSNPKWINVFVKTGK